MTKVTQKRTAKKSRKAKKSGKSQRSSSSKKRKKGTPSKSRKSTRVSCSASTRTSNRMKTTVPPADGSASVVGTTDDKDDLEEKNAEVNDDDSSVNSLGSMESESTGNPGIDYTAHEFDFYFGDFKSINYHNDTESRIPILSLSKCSFCVLCVF